MRPDKIAKKKAETTREVMYPYYTMTHFSVPYVVHGGELCIYQGCKHRILERAARDSIIAGIGATMTKARGNLVFLMKVEDPMTYDDFGQSDYSKCLTEKDWKHLESTRSHRTSYVLVASKSHYHYFGGKGKILEGEFGKFKGKFKIRGREASGHLRGDNFLELEEKDAKDLWRIFEEAGMTGMNGERPPDWDRCNRA